MMNDFNPEDKTETTEEHEENDHQGNISKGGYIKTSNYLSSETENRKEKFSSSRYQRSPAEPQDHRFVAGKKNDFLKSRTPSEE